MTKHFFKIIIPRKTGRIINIASVASKAGQPFNGSYAASKHGILSLTKTVALEMGILGVSAITVNAICPGAVKTDMLEGEDGLFEYPSKVRGINREEAAKFVTGLNLRDRLLAPEEVAGLALYLASDEAKGITGQAINIDAGQIMH